MNLRDAIEPRRPCVLSRVADGEILPVGMTWSDNGTHYWWIKRADLLRRDFSGVQYDFQCD